MLPRLSLKQVTKNKNVCLKSGILDLLDDVPQLPERCAVLNMAFKVFNEKGLP